MSESGSPDRKRSLEDDESGSESESRGGRFKRQALNSTSGDPSQPSRRSASKTEIENEIDIDHIEEDEIPSNSDSKRQGSADVTDSHRQNDDAAEAGEHKPHDAESDEPPALKSMSMRSLISAKEAGIIIGKSGKNVADIREKSGARVTVSEMIPGALERILLIIGPLDTVAKAFSLVAHKIVEEQQTSTDIKQRHTSVRILVPHTRMGSIIGKAGSKIKEIQDASGARITASEELLPNSTERTVTVQGVIDSIHIASYHIGAVLQEHPERSLGTVHYKPIPGLIISNERPSRQSSSSSHSHHNGPPPSSHYYPPSSSSHHHGGSSYHPSYHHSSSSSSGYPPHYSGSSHHHHNGYNAPPPPSYGGSSYSSSYHPPSSSSSHHRPPSYSSSSAPSPSGPSQVQQIYIPNDLVGAIIGKGGSKINEIRQQSGSQVKIGEPIPNSTERLVSVTGTPDANQMALYLLYQRLETEKARAASSSGGGGDRR